MQEYESLFLESYVIHCYPMQSKLYIVAIVAALCSKNRACLNTQAAIDCAFLFENQSWMVNIYVTPDDHK